jgi:2-polyprenyl-3-methyl-5-hydroxy-6-metoxy-1,4-benzoquinol methylase
MEKISKSVDWKSEGWDDFFIKKGSSWRRTDYKTLYRMFQIEKLTGSLLDVGCAFGDGLFFLKEIMTRISEFSGADFSPRAIESNQKKPQLQDINFFVHDVSNPFPRQYDNVICLQTLEHLPDPELAVQNLEKATKQVLIVATPYLNRRPDPNHLWKFSEADFQNYFENYYLDKNKKNIFWIKDKRNTGRKIRRIYLPRFLEKWLYC